MLTMPLNEAAHVRPAREGPLAGLAAAILDIAANRSDQLSFAEIIGGFEGHGSIGAILFVLTLPVLIPLPPGGSMIVSSPLLVVAPQLILGKQSFWLPKWLLKQHIRRDLFAKVSLRLYPLLRRIDKLGRPRLKPLTGSLGARFIGVVATTIAVVEVLPIPFSTYLPAFALILLTLGLISRDGLFILAGYAMTVIAAIGIFVGVRVMAAVVHWGSIHVHLFY